jgi:ATP-binding cassette subfamily B protein
VLLTIVAVLAITAVDMVVPQVMRIALDRGATGFDPRWLPVGTALLLGLVLTKGALMFFQGRTVERHSQGVAYDLRRQIHQRLTDLSFSFHDTSESGQLLSRSTQDVERIRFLTGRASLRLVEGTIVLLATAAVMFWMSPLLAGMATLMIPLLLWRAIAFGRTVRPLAQQEREQLGVMTSRLEQSLRGARIVKAFAQEETEQTRFEHENDEWYRISSREARATSFNAPLLTLIVQLATVAILSFGGVLIVRGHATFGQLVAFTTYLAQLARPVRLMGMVIPVVGMATASSERIFEIIDASSAIREDPDAPLLPPLTGRVEFCDVSFAYPGRGHALHSINLVAEPGDVIALLGETGSGKSTVVNLIPRFYDVTAGRVLLDGYDVRRVRLSSLREQVGVVMQESTLFAASLTENLRYGKADATDEEVTAAAVAAQAHEFISSLPEGYDTVVGELGKTLSGGQRQRVAIARAILKNPRILVLDDSTSSVDTETEHLIHLALENLMRGRTTFIIAQRLSTLRMASRVVVLQDGQIAATGSHDELYAVSSLYREIYDRQVKREADGPMEDGYAR